MSLLVGLIAAAMVKAPLEKAVTFKGAGGFELYGTLTLPADMSSSHLVPGVLLLPGSGPTDRDGNQLPAIKTDILKQISAVLVSSGVATLRFDKRATHQYIPKFPADRSTWADFFKWENFVDDASAAFRFLGAQTGVDAKRLAILGHSEGAEIALQIGSNMAGSANRPAAIVTIGGAGRPMGPILREQISRSLAKSDYPPPVRRMYMDYLNKAITSEMKDGTFPPNPPGSMGALFNVTTTKIVQSYLLIDPADLARKYPGPVLLINGAHDTQVSAERDLPKLKAALEERKSGTVESLVVPDASHNLKSTSGGNDDAFEGPVSPLAMEKIKRFIVKELHA